MGRQRPARNGAFPAGDGRAGRRTHPPLRPRATGRYCAGLRPGRPRGVRPGRPRIESSPTCATTGRTRWKRPAPTGRLAGRGHPVRTPAQRRRPAPRPDHRRLRPPASTLVVDHAENSELLRAARADISTELVYLWQGGPAENLDTWLARRGRQPDMTDIAKAAACGRPAPPAQTPGAAGSRRHSWADRRPPPVRLDHRATAHGWEAGSEDALPDRASHSTLVNNGLLSSPISPFRPGRTRTPSGDLVAKVLRGAAASGKALWVRFWHTGSNTADS